MSVTLRRLAFVAAAALVATAVQAPAARADGPEQIVNGTFDTGHRTLVGHRQHHARRQRAGGSAPTCRAAPSNPWDVIIGQDNIPLVAGETYAFRFFGHRHPGQGRQGAHPAAGRPVHPVPVREPGADRLRQRLHLHVHLAGRPAQRAGRVPDRRQRRRRGGSAWTTSRSPAAPSPTVYVPDTGPRVRVNQVGYLPKGPKNATVVTEATDAAAVAAEERRRRDVVARGITTPARRGRQLRPERAHRSTSAGTRSRAPATRSSPTARPATRSTSASDLYEQLRARRAEVLLHPAQRHRDPRQPAPGLRPAGRPRRRRAQPGRHRRAVPARRLRLPARRHAAAGTTPATTASTSSTAASPCTS